MALLTTMAITGARGAVIPPQGRDLGPGTVLMPLVFGLLAAGWCFFDGRIRGKPPVRIALMGIAIASVIGVPVYCVWSRGLRGVLLLLGSVVALSIALLVGGAVAWLALGTPHG